MKFKTLITAKLLAASTFGLYLFAYPKAWPRHEPAPLAEEPDTETVDMIAMHQAMHEAREQAFAEGYAQGHETGAQEVREALEATTLKHNKDLAERIGQRYVTLVHDTEQRL